MYVQNYNEPVKLNQWTLLRGITEYLSFDYSKKYDEATKQYNELIKTNHKLALLKELATEYRKLTYELENNTPFWKKSKLKKQLSSVDQTAIELTTRELDHSNYWEWQEKWYNSNYAQECYEKLTNKIYEDVYAPVRETRPNINEQIIQAKLELLGESAKDYTLKELVKLITEDKKY